MKNKEVVDNPLRGIGIAFRFGHDISPLPGVQQVLWFRLESTAANTAHVPSQTCYWMEHASGAVVALKLHDLDCSPEAFIPSLADLKPGDGDEQRLTDRLHLNWLFPPGFRAACPPAALLYPNQAFLWSAIKEQLSTMLAMPDFATLEERINGFLGACQQELLDRDGVVVERHALTPQHEASPSINRLDGVVDFLALAHDFKGRLSAEILGLFDDFASLLDARTLTIENYNMARCWPTTQRRNRIQAIRAFPWLFHELGLRSGGSDCYHEPAGTTADMSAAIAAAIDLGQPLLPLLARQYRVNKHTLRYARPFLKSRHRHPGSIPAMLWFLDGIKPDMRPASYADMALLHNAIDWISGWQQESDRVYVDAVARTLFKDGVAGFRSLHKKWFPSHNPDNPFSDVADYLARYEAMEEGGLITQELFDSLIKEWISEAGLLALFAESERWHASLWEWDAGMEAASWLSLTQASQQFGNRMAHELSNTQLLIEEGHVMHHCIASYASLCKAGEAFIFSLRDKEGGKRRSTLYIGLSKAGRFTIQEHRAFANGDPDQDCVEAANALIEWAAKLRGTRAPGI